MDPLRLKRGDTWSTRWYCYSTATDPHVVALAPIGEPLPSGTPVDLTGAAVRLHVRDRAGLLYYWASLADDITTDAGIVTVTAPYSRTESLDPKRRYSTDLEITLASGVRASSATYPVVVEQDSTYTASGEPVSPSGGDVVIPDPTTLADDRLLITKGGRWVDGSVSVASGGVPEAPEDGKQYARKDGGWTEVQAASASSVAWADITGKPAFGTAALANTTAFDASGAATTAVSSHTSTYDHALLMTSAERAKLSGIATGATANATDAQLRDRSTHTGSQAISTVTGLQTALDGKATTAQGAKADTALQPSDIGSTVQAYNANAIAGDGTILNIVALTNAAYQALGTKVSTTLYIITDA